MGNQRTPNLGALFTTTQPDWPGGRNFIANYPLYTTDNGPASSFILNASGSLINYLGTGADGIGTFNSPSSATVSTADSSVVIKNFTSLTIGSTGSYTASTRCQTMIIYVQGNCTINGTLTMTARGASAIAASSYNLTRYFTDTSLFPTEANQLGIAETLTLAQVGGTGGAGVTDTIGQNPGNTATNGTGGGGSGASYSGGLGTSGSGATGTAFSGGAGGGAASYNSGATNGAAGGANGGAGGNAGAAGVSQGAGGGAGNPGGIGMAGSSATGSPGSNGIGGTLILIVGGTLSGTGTISSNGSNGGGATDTGGNSVGGGGSGAGRILIFANVNTFSGTGTTQANGGAGGTATGTGSESGGAGGAGAISTQLINSYPMQFLA